MAARDRRGRRRGTARPIRLLLFALLAAAVVISASCKHGSETEATPMQPTEPPAASGAGIRPAAVAGPFYPDDRDELASFVNELLANADPEKPDKPIMVLIVPHAGYVFSGSVAAHGFKAINGQGITTVVLIGNSHHAHYNAASVGDFDAYETPLGRVPVDEDMVRRLLDSGAPFESVRPAHALEHSLEVELPFLQTVLQDFKIVPILLGDETPELTQAVGQGIAKALQGRKDFLIVCSTDMSHYPAYEDAKRVDRQTIDAILTMDESGIRQNDKERLAEGVRELHCTLCGLGATCAAIEAAKTLGAESAVLLKYANSGDVEGIGDRGRVVGYCAIAMCGEAGTMPDEQASTSADALKAGDLNEEQKATLLRIARESLTAAVRGEKEPDPQVEDPRLNEECGAFVTLKKQGQLRGCIGYIEAVKPLWRTVADVAASAALNDYRFSPVSPSELEDLDLEISALTPLTRIDDPEEIVIGRHGLVIRKGSRQGLLLPQVATEWGWDTLEFLDHTCQKAGLPAGAWKDPDAEVLLFGAQVFGESRP